MKSFLLCLATVVCIAVTVAADDKPQIKVRKDKILFNSLSDNEWKEFFNMYVSDDKKKITKANVAELVKQKIRVQLNETQLDIMLKDAEATDGEITLEVFKKMLVSGYIVDDTEQWAKFKPLQKDGKITFDQCKTLISTTDDILTKADTDGDKNVNYEEFVKISFGIIEEESRIQAKEKEEKERKEREAAEKLKKKQADEEERRNMGLPPAEEEEEKKAHTEEKTDGKDQTQATTEAAKPAAAEQTQATTEAAKPAATEAAKPAATEAAKPAAVEEKKDSKPPAEETKK